MRSFSRFMRVWSLRGLRPKEPDRLNCFFGLAVDWSEAVFESSLVSNVTEFLPNPDSVSAHTSETPYISELF